MRRSGVPHCDSCLQEYPPGSRFCVHCGRPLVDIAEPGHIVRSSLRDSVGAWEGTRRAARNDLPATAEAGGRSIERRHLTVLFCDLVDSTRLAARVDPEDWHHAMGMYRQAVRAAVSSYSGYVAQFQGDGVIACFGFPAAHEDDPSRAVRAGLAIVDSLRALDDELAHLPIGPLAVRVGIDAGVAVVEKNERELDRATTAIGTPANLAARIQAMAEPNCVLITDTVRRLTAGEFVTGDLGEFEIRGVDAPVRLHSVLAASGIRSRLKAAELLTPFVGRTEELSLLLERWRQIRQGAGRAVLVSGEAGIGKSRLVLTLQEQLADEPHTWLECCASPYTTHAAFAPIVELIERGLRFADNDDHDAKIAKIRQRAARDGMDAEELSAIVAPLLGLAAEPPPGAVDPDVRDRTIRMFVDWTITLARTQPVVLHFEDLHWCDPSTIEFIERLLDEESRILVLMTARPKLDIAWREDRPPECLALDRLDAPTVRELLELAWHDALTDEAAETIVTRADGIPLYVEELAKMLVERQAREPRAATDRTARPPAIPETLHDLLMARLDGLEGAKEIARLASVIGREIPLALLERVSDMSAERLRAGIQQLLEAGILFSHDAGTHSTLLFKHALLQDAAYESLLKETRRRNHERIADELVRSFPELAASRPEIVARHYTEARRLVDAVAYWTKAGRRALETSANVEATAYAESGLALVGDIAGEEARLTAELGLQLVLGPSLMASRGYADPSMERAYGRAREICRRLGDPPAVFPVMFGLWTFHCVRARHDEAAAIARDMTALAEREHDDALLLEADVTAGITHFYVGELEASTRRLERAIRLYDPKRDAEHCLVYGQDPRAAALAHLMLARWTLGDVDGAHEAATDAARLAREITHPFSIAYVLSFAAWLHRLREDCRACSAIAEEAIEVSGKQTLAVFLAISEILDGSAKIALGEHTAGAERLAAGYERFCATASLLILPYWSCLRADALAESGGMTEALVEIETAIERIDISGERQAEAEAYRIRAALRKAAGRPAAEVERDLRHAVAVARAQGARSWELRSAIALSALLADTSRGAEALELLDSARRWFPTASSEHDVIAADLHLAMLRAGRSSSVSERIPT